MKKTVLITGVTGSIGKATAMELAKSGCHLILLGRNSEKLSGVKSELIEATGNDDFETIVADLSEPESVKKAAAEIRSRHKYINALINVASVLKSKRLNNTQGLEYMFATNHLGPFILTNELLDLLKAGKPSKIVTVSAPSTSKINFDAIRGMEKFPSGNLGAFGSSKMMNLMFTYALARRLEGTGVTANVFHPGLVRSDLLKESPKLMYYFFRIISSPPGRAAKMLCRLATDSSYESSNGIFYKYDGSLLKPNSYSCDMDLQEKLWSLSEQLTN